MSNQLTFIPTPKRLFGSGNVDYTVICPEDTTYDLCDSSHYLKTPLLPNPVTHHHNFGCKQYIMDSPYEDTPCLCLPFLKMDGIWTLQCNSIFPANYTSATQALVSSAPGDGFVYLLIGGGGLTSYRCGSIVPTESLGGNDYIDSAEVVIIVRPFL